MPYEAFANALARITGDYANTMQEQRLHERERQDKLSDIESERNFVRERDAQRKQDTMELAQKQSDIAFNERLKEIQQLDPARARMALQIAAEQLGAKNASEMAPDALHDFVVKKRREDGAADIMAQALAQASANSAATLQTLSDPNNAKIAELAQTQVEQKNAKQIASAQQALQDATNQLNTILRNSNVPGEIVTLDSLAKQKLDEYLAATPPKEVVDEAGIVAIRTGAVPPKNPAEARAFLLAHPVSWAQKQGYDEKMVADMNRSTALAIRNSAIGDSQAVTGLMQQINTLTRDLVGFGAYKSPAAAPVDSVASAGRPAAPQSGPVFRAPGGASPSPTTSTPPTPAPSSFGGVSGWWQSGGARDLASIPQTVGRVIDTPARIVANGANYLWSGRMPDIKGPAESAGEKLTDALNPSNVIPQTPAAAPTPAPTPAPAGGRQWVDGSQPAGTSATYFASGQPQSAQRAAAMQWLEQNVPSLDPVTRESLLSEYDQVMNSPLPVEEKTRRVQSLQTRAMSLGNSGSFSYWR